MGQDKRPLNIEIVINILLLCFCVFCFIYVGFDVPPTSVSRVFPGSMWPRMILGGLIIIIPFNIYSCYKNNSLGSGRVTTLRELMPPIFLKSFALMVCYAAVMNHIGFLLSTFIFVTLFSYLIGLRKKFQILLGGLITTGALYAMFQIFLQIRLPRGVGIFRDFSLFIEMML